MKILLIGAQGRLGKSIVETAKKSPLITAIYEIGSPKSTLPSDINPFLSLIDIVLDVSTPLALETNLPKITHAKKPLVIGSTGHTPLQIKTIQDASKRIPIFMTPNFSPGISYLKELIKHLPHLGSYHIEDKHHAQKKDAPSGTAKDLASLLPLTPTISSIREGTEIGCHTISLQLPFETLEIRHTVHSRDLFAFGAIEACRFLVQQPVGFYQMINSSKGCELNCHSCYSDLHD